MPNMSAELHAAVIAPPPVERWDQPIEPKTTSGATPKPDIGFVLSLIAEDSTLGIIVIGESGEVLYSNNLARDLCRPDAVSLEGYKISKLLPGALMVGGTLILNMHQPPYGCDCIALISGDGAPRYCEVRQRQATDEQGRRFNIVMLDEVTKRVQALAALKDQEARWNLALQGSEIGVFETDLRSGQCVASDTWFQLAGISNWHGLNAEDEWRMRVHPDDMPRVLTADEECFAGRIERSETKYRFRVGESEWRWMRSILRVTERGADGRAVRMLGTMVDIDSLERAVQHARAKEEELGTLIANAPVAMAVLSLDGTFQLLNEACYRLLGYPNGSLQGVNLWKLSNGEMLSEVRDDIKALIRGDVETYVAEKIYVRLDGVRVEIVLRISLISDHKPGHARFIAQMVDITERKRLAGLKDDFVSTVSHELRTPLASLHGALALLTSPVLKGKPDDARGLLELAFRNSTRLKQLVDDLLDFQRLSAEQVPLEISDTNVVELVRETVAECEPFAARFDVTYQLNAPDREISAAADAKRLRQVVANLLSNAAKFSYAADCVTVSIDAEPEGCVIAVANHGRGISSEFESRIFTPFSQQAEHSTRDREGSGLGLAISRKLVEGMNGEIGYRSVPDDQTMFWVRLPLSAA